jgi:hypothetical protein
MYMCVYVTYVDLPVSNVPSVIQMKYAAINSLNVAHLLGLSIIIVQHCNIYIQTRDGNFAVRDFTQILLVKRELLI